MQKGARLAALILMSTCEALRRCVNNIIKWIINNAQSATTKYIMLNAISQHECATTMNTDEYIGVFINENYVICIQFETAKT